MSILPVFQFPITLVWIDDDLPFLKAATYKFGKNYLIKYFSNPLEALDFFNSYEQPTKSINFLESNTKDEFYDSENQSPAYLNLDSLHLLSKLSVKNKEIGVLIIDHQMPYINGIEFCRKIKLLPLKKILLTGEIDNQEAILAFNDSIIDRFVKKDDGDLIETLNLYIKTLIRQYFIETTKNLLTHLEIDHKLPLSDEKFLSFFDTFCKEKEIVEFYLIDKVGSFMLINSLGEKSYLVVHTDKSLKDFCDLFEDETRVTEEINIILSRNKIPFFGYGINPIDINFSEWREFLYKPNIIDGREKYYWTYVNDMESYYESIISKK